MLVLLLLACGECDGPYARCEGNVAATCGWQWLNEVWGRWERRAVDCGADVCVEAEDDAFCALDAAPDPACPDALRERWTASGCVDGALVTWRYGFRVDEAACVAGATCVDPATPGFDPDCTGEAFCSPMATADPLCADDPFTTCEDARTIVYCRCGFRWEAHACVDPGPSCVLLEFEGTVQGACR